MVSRPENIDDADFANYFCTYGFLYHQREMLEDQRRMRAYYSAVFENAECFKDKVVLDVGTGSGILAIWAAQAGAKKVYAVEATYMAGHADTVAKHNGVGDRVEIIQGYVEKIELPEKVDIIISEWMGYFLFRESMLDSVIVARDKFLKPGGAMYPSHANVFLGPLRSSVPAQKVAEFQSSVAGWKNFTQVTTANYGVDLSCLNQHFEHEQHKYYCQTSLWSDLHPSQMIGQPAVIKSIDLHHVSIDDIKELNEEFDIQIDPMCPADMTMMGFGGWFDVFFRGSPENPSKAAVRLTTEPDAEGATHWGQQAFFLHPALPCGPNDRIRGRLRMVRNKENHRLLDIGITHSLCRIVEGQEVAAPPCTNLFHIE